MNQETQPKKTPFDYIANTLLILITFIVIGIIPILAFRYEEEKTKAKQLTIDKAECYQEHLNMKRDRDNCNKNCYKVKGGDVWE